MRDKTIRALGATLVLLVIAVAAVAQMGGGGDPSAITIQPEATADSIPDTTSAEFTDTSEKEPFTYRVGVLAGISTDNFWAFYGSEPTVWNAYILGPTKPALFSLGTSGQLEPELISGDARLEETDEGWQALVTLTDGFEWSDGKPITAYDLEFTYLVVEELDLGGSWAQSFPDEVESVRASSVTELVITFDAEPPLAVWPHGVGMAPFMPKHVWESRVGDLEDDDDLYGLPASEDVGGGPLALHTVGEELIVSVPNPGYPTMPNFDRIEYMVLEAEAAVESLEKGRVDVLLTPDGLTADEATTVAADPGVEVVVSPTNTIRYLGFNLEREPMSDLAFREALSLLVDRHGLVENSGVAGVAAYTVLTGSNERWFDEAAAQKLADPYSAPLQDRLEAAVSLLEEAGYAWDEPPSIDSEGEPVAGKGLRIGDLEPAPLTILTSGDAYDPTRPEYASGIAETLAWIGFDARPVETDFDSVVDLTFSADEGGKHQYDMYLLGWTLGSPALPGYYGTLFSTGSPLNNTGYSNEEFDELADVYLSSSDYEEAREALWAMEELLAADLPYLVLYTSNISEAYRADRIEIPDALGLGGLQGLLGGVLEVEPAA